MAEVPEVICGEKYASCVCVLAPHDDERHACVPECGGRWRSVDGQLTAIEALPSGVIR